MKLNKPNKYSPSMRDDDIICHICLRDATYIYETKLGFLLARCDYHNNTLLDDRTDLVRLTKNDVIVRKIHET